MNSNSEVESVLASLVEVLLHFKRTSEKLQFSCLRCEPLLKAASYNLLKVGRLRTVPPFHYGIYVAGLKNSGFARFTNLLLEQMLARAVGVQKEN